MAEKDPGYTIDGVNIKLQFGKDYPEEWVEFRVDNWMYGEYVRFSKAIATDYMDMLLDRVVAWQVKDDVSGAFIEFDREFLKAHQEALNITGKKQRKFVELYYRAYNLAATLDLEKK